MKVSLKELQKYFDTKLPSVDELSSAFTFHLAEVESVEMKDEDIIMDLKILPDRSYAKSYEGVAREVAAILNIPTKAPIPSTTKKIDIRSEDINTALGTDISSDQIVSILKRLGMEVIEQKDVLLLLVPEDRSDIVDSRDIAEEVGRIYGYDKIKEVMPQKMSIGSKTDKAYYYAEKIKNTLCEAGFSEVYTYSLLPQGHFEVEKPLASDKNFLRSNLTFGIKMALDLNAKNADLLALTEIRIFEIGRVFSTEGEHTALALGIRNVKKSKERENDKIKVSRDVLFETLGIQATILCTADDSGGIISLGGKTIGSANHEDGIMELNFEALLEAMPEGKSYADLSFGRPTDIKYEKFSAYPFIARDIAVFVPVTVSTNDLEKVILSKTGDLLVKHYLFDEFKKGDKTSFGFRLIFQSLDRTLTDEEVNKIMEGIYTEVKGKDWEVR